MCKFSGRKLPAACSVSDGAAVVFSSYFPLVVAFAAILIILANSFVLLCVFYC